MAFNPFDPDDWESVLGEMQRGFTSFGNLVANGSVSVVGTIGDGVIGVYKDTAGGLAYAFDATKTTALDVGNWTEGAAGSVADFSVDTYSKAKQGLEDAWAKLNEYFLLDLIQLGDYDPRARECMRYLLGGSEAAVAGWESSARSLGYTMAFNFKCSLQMIGEASAFSGIYLENSGRWGFIYGAETQNSSPIAVPNASAQFEMWMVFGSKECFGEKCFQLGLTLELPVSLGLRASFDGKVLLSSGLSFRGFKLGISGGLGGLTLVGGTSITPSMDPPDSSIISDALAGQASGLDAAVRGLKNPSAEPKMIASAALSTLPFVRQPNGMIYIQVKGSRKFYDVSFASGDTRTEVYQTALTGYANQEFVFKDNGDGTYLIKPTLCRIVNAAFDIAGASSENSAALITYPVHAQNNQRFQVMSSDNGWYYLVNKNSGKVLSSAGGGVGDKTTIVQRTWDHGQDQMVRFFTTTDFPRQGRTYSLTNVATSQQLTVGGFQPRLSAVPTSGRLYDWLIEGTTNGSICMRNAEGQYLTPYSSTSVSTTGTQTPGWHIAPTGDGVFTIERDGKHLVGDASSLQLYCTEYCIPGKQAQYDFGATGRTWTLPEEGRGIISFIADCAVDDVYVLLTSALGNTSAAYEITIGGWNNELSVIKRGSGSSGTELARAPVGLANRGGQNPLWVAIDSKTGRIDVGRGVPGSDCFLTCKDPNFISAVRYVTFSSWENPIQYLQVITHALAPNSSTAVPARTGAYDYSAGSSFFMLSEAGRGTVSFSANGTNDVHIALSTKTDASGELYEIVIGGWSNTHSTIRRGAQGQQLLYVEAKLLAPGKPNQLWVSINKDTKRIEVGRGLPGRDVIMSVTDPNFLSAAQYIRFTTWDKPIDYSNVRTLALGADPAVLAPKLGQGLWRLTEVANVPAANGAYDPARPQWLLMDGRGVFAFTADMNDLYIRIATQDGSSAAYEFVVGGWNNTKTVLRRGGTEIASVPVGLTTPGKPNQLWLSIDDRSGIIQMGRGAPGQDVFLFCVDQTLRSAPKPPWRWVALSAWGQLIQVANITVQSISASISMTPPEAPGMGIWMANLPIEGSLRWVTGCAVRYAVAFELPDGSELRGPWWSVPGIDGNNYYRPGYACPVLTNVSVDPSRRAVARRIYRQFLGEATETRIARIANNTDVSFGDGDTLLPLKWDRQVLGDLGVTGVKRANITLPNLTGQAPPVALVSTSGEDWQDTFTASTSVVNTTSATINVYRADALSRWGQNLLVNVLTSSAINFGELRSGSVAFGGSGSQLMQRTITFPRAFGQMPRVLASVRGENNADTFACTVTNVTSTSFSINILRVDTASGWSQNVRVDWMAFLPEALSQFKATAVDHGIATLGTGTAAVKRVPVSFNRTFSAPPILLMTAHGEPYSDVFALTGTLLGTSGFTCNAKRVDAPANGWGLNLRVHWLALL